MAGRQMPGAFGQDCESGEPLNIGKEDIPLQKEQFEREKKGSQPEIMIQVHHDETKIDSGLTKKSKSCIESAPAGKESFCIEKQYWNKDKRQWQLMPSDAQHQPDTFHECFLFVRRKHTEKGKYIRTVILVKGAEIRRALRRIFRNVEGFNLTGDNKTELNEPKFLYWALEELNLLKSHYKKPKKRDDKRDDKKSEIDATLALIHELWRKDHARLKSLFPQDIEFHLLWMIFPPDCLIVSKDSIGNDWIWRARSHRMQRQNDRSYSFQIHGEFIDWDGTSLGTAEKTLHIGQFEGRMAIQDLAYVPLKHHPRRQDLITQVKTRSEKKKRQFCHQKFEFRSYDGMGLCKIRDDVVPFRFDSRVMIDPVMMNQVNRQNDIIPELKRGRASARVWVSDLVTVEEFRKKSLNALLEAPSKNFTSDDEWCTDDSDGEIFIKSFDPRMIPILSRDNMTEEENLILSPLVYGYSFGNSEWGAFSVDNLSEVTWNDKLCSSLFIPETEESKPLFKTMIRKLVRAHVSNVSNRSHAVKVKGRGLIGHLYGPPGSGKTLTAEVIAEIGRIPLYIVSSGTLGHEASTIHRNLVQILNLAAHWKAVLLLHSADVYLAERLTPDLKQNAIVSVFLRELECYEGIMLLTTNEIKIGKAFSSCIHFSHQYQTLDFGGRKAIWENLVKEANGFNKITVDFGDDSIQKLANMELNGHQIKNTMSIAVKLKLTTPKAQATGTAHPKLTVNELMNAAQFIHASYDSAGNNTSKEAGSKAAGAKPINGTPAAPSPTRRKRNKR